MKKTIYTIALAALGTLALALPASASTADFSPASFTVTKGQTFTMTVSIDPQGVSNYAEKLQLDFPAGILQVSSFSQAGNWMSLTQSGYDSIDNANGTMTKSAGYPSGFSSATVFGTVTFRAIAAGQASVTVDPASTAYAASAHAALTGTAVAVIVDPAPAVQASPAAAQSAGTVSSSSSNDQTAAATGSSSSANGSFGATQTAAAGNASGAGMSVWLWIILAIVVILAIAYVYMMMRKKRGSNIQ